VTPCYECNWVITGNSKNKGRFREEGESSIRRCPGELRDEEDLRAQFIKGVIQGYIDASQLWRTKPQYLGLSELKVELGAIRIVGDEALGQTGEA
jgi:hypothetical protein